MICGIYDFTTQFKTKIDVIPRTPFNVLYSTIRYIPEMTHVARMLETRVIFSDKIPNRAYTISMHILGRTNGEKTRNKM